MHHENEAIHHRIQAKDCFCWSPSDKCFGLRILRILPQNHFLNHLIFGLNVLSMLYPVETSDPWRGGSSPGIPILYHLTKGLIAFKILDNWMEMKTCIHLEVDWWGNHNWRIWGVSRCFMLRKRCHVIHETKLNKTRKVSFYATSLTLLMYALEFELVYKTRVDLKGTKL